ncbi:adenine deaminase [Levilactobacillus bambusae]|uniref:Adenine deaminase n=1 Tax=Levilactobacillus bambusae TaxID=2024736 RepID=A0A2V1N001_9LACO|nr:adenine deaminase [Levilactobacillus bambusae]PWG00544.1 adenine deaminase [Levilactobacillus bambusae]
MTTTVDLKLTGAQVLNVFSRQFEPLTLWITGGQIISNQLDANLEATKTIDLTGKWVVPGLIDAHVHMESALVSPSEFGQVVLNHGVTTIVTDPHELANVTGIDGITYLIQDARQTPLDVQFMLPSSVPCVPFDHNGATLSAADLADLYAYPEVNGLAEVMDYPGIVRHDADLLQKIQDARRHGDHVDGHAAGYSEAMLNQLAGAGIDTDHECVSVAEAEARLRAGMAVFLRQGSVENDLLNTIGAVTEANAHRFAFCTDDKTISDLVHEGSIDHNVRLAIQSGMRPALAYTLASYNAAQIHRLWNRGALSAGYLADLVVLDNPEAVTINRVMKNGQWVTAESVTKPLAFTQNTMHHHVQLADLQLPLHGQPVHVMTIEPNHITTGHDLAALPKTPNFEADLTNDLLKMVVVERHRRLGTVGLGLVHGFQLTSGAVATSIAHDAHNIVAFGTSDADILLAIQQITATNGGIAVVNQGQVLASMPLAIGGILSDQPYATVSQQLTSLTAAYQSLSTADPFDPFITLSFLTLPVIPTLKLTDQGLYDVERGQFIPLEVDEP